MNVIVAAFYADVIGKPSRFLEYLPLIRASKRALALTNPGARYVVLTDSMTGALLEPHLIEYDVVAPEHMPLMSKYIFAQRMAMSRLEADLIILADVDCLANRSLDDALPDEVGLAVTHKGEKFQYKINNVAYVRDRDLTKRFLGKAYETLDTWPLEKRLWGGDQESWDAVLGDPGNWTPLGGDRFAATTSEGIVHVYPCATHNRPLADDGGIRPQRHGPAYLIHLKGPRKHHLDKFMTERFG